MLSPFVDLVRKKCVMFLFHLKYSKLNGFTLMTCFSMVSIQDKANFITFTCCVVVSG